MSYLNQLPPNRRYPLRFQTYNGVTIGVKQHAIKRAAQRGVDLRALLESLHGVSVSDYKKHGVVGKWNPYQRHIAILTVWYVGEAKRSLALAQCSA